MCRAHQRGPEGLPSEILGLEGYTFMIKKISWKNIVWKYFFRRFGKVGMAQNQHFGGNPLFNLTREIWVLGHAHFTEPLKKYFQTIFFYEIFFIIKVYLSTCAWAPQNTPRTSHKHSATWNSSYSPPHGGYQITAFISEKKKYPSPSKFKLL